MVSQADPLNLNSLATEQRNSATAEMDLLPTEALLTAINSEDQRVAHTVASEIPNIARAVDAIVAAIRSGGRLIYTGAGTSGRLGVLDASECPPTFNTDPSLVIGLIAGGDHALRNSIEHVEDDPDAGASDLRDVNVTGQDVVVGIAASGRTPYVLGAVAHARSLGATTVGISCSPGSALATAADIAITPVVGPEVVTGSTRLKSGTAQKLVLNMLTTASMVRLGKTFGNLMVDVQTKNEKLRERAVRIVREATGATDASARAALAAADGEVKTAIVALILDLDAPEARARVERAGGIVRAAIDGATS